MGLREWRLWGQSVQGATQVGLTWYVFFLTSLHVCIMKCPAIVFSSPSPYNNILNVTRAIADVFFP